MPLSQRDVLVGIAAAVRKELAARRRHVYVMFKNWWLHDDTRRFVARYGGGVDRS